jgi:probable blue pigment (indigoidine) exporter
MLVAEGVPGDITVTNITGFAYLSVIGALIAYAVWFRGIERLPALAVSFLSLGSPLVATILGYIFLSQGLSPLQIVGALAVVGAVVLAQVRQPEKAQAPTESTPSIGQARAVTCES